MYEVQLIFQVAQYAVLIVKYAKDQRYDESGIATHCGQVGLKKSMQTTQKFVNKDFKNHFIPGATSCFG